MTNKLGSTKSYLIKELGKEEGEKAYTKIKATNIVKETKKNQENKRIIQLHREYWKLMKEESMIIDLIHKGDKPVLNNIMEFPLRQ